MLVKFTETMGMARRLGRGLNDLGNAYVAAGDVSNAIDTLREAVEVKRRSGGQGFGSCAERSGQCVCGSR